MFELCYTAHLNCIVFLSIMRRHYFDTEIYDAFWKIVSKTGISCKLLK